jgi:hypothetical protein
MSLPELTGFSALPCSLDPLADESLPGYLLRLAHRLEMTPARLLQLTTLTPDTDRTRSAPRAMMLHLDEARTASFARATRLTPSEVAALCMSGMSDRYRWTAPATTSDQWGPRSLTNPWVFTSATRYCPQCLAGDGSPQQQQFGSAWRRTWRLPIVFACPLHRRLLEHLCPACRQPAMSGPHASTGLIPHAHRSGLGPAQCRATGQPAEGSPRGSTCGARLDTFEATRTGEPPALEDLLALQDRLLALLHPQGPATTMSVGSPAPAVEYFADLRMVCGLLNGAWPAGRHLIADPVHADSLDQYISKQSGDGKPRHYRLYDAPPLDPLPSAALFAAAVRILDGADLRPLAEFLVPFQSGSRKASPRGRWTLRYERVGHECSDGFRNAVEPLHATLPGTYGRSRPSRRLLSRIDFNPEHIPEQLQDDWFHQHFQHVDEARPRLIRRAAALRLVQMSAGGSLSEAVEFLGIDQRYIAASSGAAFAAAACQTADAGAAAFRFAVHALAQQLNSTSGLIDYRYRREALKAWFIDPETWQDIIDRLPPTKGPFRPEISDCKRQFASEVVWARITQGEHILAPRIIEDQLSHLDPTWHRRRCNMWHFYLADAAKPHYADLREILNAHADSLATAIDRQAQRAEPAPRPTHKPTPSQIDSRSGCG